MSDHDDRVRDALEASIAHWRRNAAASRVGDVSVGPSACALCKMFNRGVEGAGPYCGQCPVKKRTGRPLCMGSPYGEASAAYADWMQAVREKRVSVREFRDAFRAAAAAEVAFLESLR